MDREHFIRIVSQVLDTLPEEFRDAIHNVAVLVEDRPPRRRVPRPVHPHPRHLLLGLFVGTPATHKSIFDVSQGPDYVILYQKNIEAVSRSEAELRDQIRRTVVHELGHYFGLNERELRDV